MQTVATLPPEVITSIGSESIDFSLQAGKHMPPIYGYLLVGAGIFMFLLMAPWAFVLAIADPNNSQLTVPIRIFLISAILIVSLLGIFSLKVGVNALRNRGGYFVATPKRLIHFYNDNLRSYIWSEFMGDIRVTGDTQKGSLELRYSDDGTVGKGKKGVYFIRLNIVDIQNVYEIERICRMRIEENKA